MTTSKSKLQKPQMWLIINDRSMGIKRRRYRAEAEQQGFEVTEIDESSINWLEVAGGEVSIAFKNQSPSGIKLPAPTVVISICGIHFISPMASEVVRQLECMGNSAIANSSVAKEIADNKWWTHQKLTKAGVATPRTIYVSKNQYASLRQAAESLGYPVVLKTLYGNKGQGVWLCKSIEEVEKNVAALEPDREILLQEYLAASHGRDVRAIVIDGKVVASMIRTAEAGGFHANLGAEGRGVTVTLSDEQKSMAVAAAKAVGLFFCWS